MEFGKVTDPGSIDWTLPADAAITGRVLNSAPVSSPRIYIGSTMWADREFIGPVYPRSTRPPDFLRAYARQFNCIELNSTFYHSPSVQQVKQWVRQVPEDFKFCPKVFRDISHDPRLGVGTENLENFLNSIREFGSNLGPCFMQLPPNFGPAHGRKLQQFLERWPSDLELSVEFRHPAWFAESTFNRTAEFLHRMQTGLVITDVGGRRDVLHMGLSTKFAVIRWVGTIHESDSKRLEMWARRLRRWFDSGLQAVYVFTHQPESVASAASAAAFWELLQTELPTSTGRAPLIPPPEHFGSTGQYGLFD